MNTPSIPELLDRIHYLESCNEKLTALLNANHIPLPEECLPSPGETPPPNNVKACAIANCTPAPVQVQMPLNTASDSPQLTKQSPLDERIALFMSLFRGRMDVYAKYWENTDTGKHGYSPVCANRWTEGMCPKLVSKFKCPNCSNTAYVPLTPDVIRDHLEEKAVYGIYTILPGDLCHFLTIDFDEDDWRKAVTLIREVCTELDIPCAVEISRSGNGAHIWFFFEQAETAAQARQFGSQLIGRTLNKNARMPFSSYDRMFPNQNKMPEGGIGNLIALPFQPKAARLHGGSIFVDENFRKYPDQWAYLSSIKRISHSTLVRLADEMTPPVVIKPSTPNKPWVRKASPTEADFSDPVSITLADRMYIDTQGQSDKALTSIKSIATFRNKKFYQNQNCRLSVYNVPRYICAAEFIDNYLVLPRNCFDEVNDLLTQCGHSPVLTDEREQGCPIQVSFNGKLRDEQPQALKALGAHDSGILYAATAFGKTVVAAALIAEKKVNTLVIVNRRNLLDQWQKRLMEYLTIEDAPSAATSARKKQEQIGRFCSGINTRSGKIDVTTLQSLGKNDNIKEWINDYGMIIVDECHHSSAVTYENILKTVRAKYIYGLTATPERADSHEPLLYMYLGPIRYQADALTQAMLRPFSHQMIPRFTGGNYHSDDKTQLSLAQIYSLIAEDEIRNAMILEDIRENISEKRSCLVLSERVEHVHVLADSIREMTPNTFVLTGRINNAERQKQLHAIQSVSKDEPLVICATGRYIGEGFDEARLDTLFLTMPIAWKGTLSQYAGRLHRLYEGKVEARIYDYIDNNTEMLAHMYNKRLKGYAGIGYQPSIRLENAETADVIYQTDNYTDVFISDLQDAARSITIASPYIAKAFINRLRETLYLAVCRQVKISILCSYPDDFSENASASMQAALVTLNELGISISQTHKAPQRYAVIDDHIVWYGGINLLGGSGNESMLRLVSARIADAVAGE